MSEDKKVSVEQKRLRGRNTYEVINQIVNEFNSSEGWALVKAVPIGVTTLDVYLERSSKQAIPKKSTKAESKEKLDEAEERAIVKDEEEVKVEPKASTKTKAAPKAKQEAKK